MINKTLYRKQRLSNENLLKTGNELRYSGREVVPAPLIYETVWTFICIKYIQFGLVLGRVFNATFNNITVISWRSALLVEETEYMEKTTDLPQVIDKWNLKINVVLKVSSAAVIR